MIDVAGMDGLPVERWMSQIEESDVIVMGGGANYFLSYWLEKSGLFARLPELLETKVYVGASAGSMLMQKRLCTGSEAMKHFAEGNWELDLSNLGPASRTSGAALALIDFLIRPHYKSAMPQLITDELLQRVASYFNQPLYALDDDSAVKIVDDKITVISEGEWKLFKPGAEK
jgi:dipeptidase E